MSISIEEAAERIIVCDEHSLGQKLSTDNKIGLIIESTKRLQGEKIPYGDIPHFDATGIDQDVIKQNVLSACDFLENNPNKKVIIFCNHGIGRSPLFALRILHQLSGKNPDWRKILAAIHKIRPQMNSHILPIAEETLGMDAQIGSDYVFAKDILKAFQKGDTLEPFIKRLQLREEFPVSSVDIINLCIQFGMTVEMAPKDTAPYDASNDRQGQPPSSLHTRECP